MTFIVTLVLSLFAFVSTPPPALAAPTAISQSTQPPAAPIAIPAPTKKVAVAPIQKTAAVVPFYSQFKDISSPKWQKQGCGIASLAMVINYYKPHAVGVDALLKQGIAAGAYDTNAGWIHSGLISLGKRYGLSGSTNDLSKLSSKAALAELEKTVAKGPVIASVHYKFEPTNPIPHLVVVTAVKNGMVYFNDPAAKTGQQQISVAKFLGAWKKRFIVIRPAAAV
ncbi:MAG: C39 family peptidase [Bacillota bacterium]